MKILIINPNSDDRMTSYMKKTADNFAAGYFEVMVKSTPGANLFIGSYTDIIKSVPGMIQLIHEGENEYDGFIIACGLDPNLDLMKEMSKKPVVGIAESSMKIASMLGHKFAVIQLTRKSISRKEELIRKYHMNQLGFAIAPEEDINDFRDLDKIIKVCRRAISNCGAETIILSCAGMSGLDIEISHKLGVPVLDGVKCGLIIMWGMIKGGFSVSKIGRYCYP